MPTTPSATPSEHRRAPTQAETDQKMLNWMEKQFSKFAEDGGNRNFGDAIISRFRELIGNQASTTRCLATVEDAHKLAMSQVQFAQSVIRQLERQVATQQKMLGHQPENGDDDGTDPEAEKSGK